MPKIAHPSRLNPGYLAARHGGTLFLVAALGLTCGLAVRALLEPTAYQSEAELSLTVVPAESAARFDWDAKRGEWLAILKDEGEKSLLGANLRYILKLAVTHDLAPDPVVFAAEIATFEPSRTYSAALLPGPVGSRLGPVLKLTRRDLAANLDFQSLAAVVADLDPPNDAANWDFSFFRSGAGSVERGMEGFMITRPGPEDRFFRVFYHLHGITHPGRRAVTPEEAWRAAVDEVADRLDREGRFSGGGGFGPRARRELARELAAIPALAANNLYHAVPWSNGDGNFRADTDLWSRRWESDASLELSHSTVAAGRLEARAELNLYPLCSPRDTILTRLPPLMVATLLAYVSARENATAAPETPAPPAPEPAPEPEAAKDPAEAPTPETRIAEVIPDQDAIRHRQRVRAAEDSLQEARLALDEARRRLETARTREKRLNGEALAARARADRLRERHEEFQAVPMPEPEETVSLETARLLLIRNEILERLAGLLEHCTEEHPFVRQARRDLAAVDSLLAGQPAPPRPAGDGGAARLNAMRLEWETASASADALEERRRRQTAEVEAALAALAPAERRVADLEATLARLREDAPKPRSVAVAAPARAPLPAAPTPVRSETPGVRVPPPTPAFSAVPSRVSLVRFRPSWETPAKGLILGLILGLIWTLARGLLTFKFANTREAVRLLAYPRLATLPAYDAKSLRSAAKGAKGEVMGNPADGLYFVPTPVELSEPQPVGRRGKILPAKRRPRLLVWVLGFLILAGGIFLHLSSRAGFAQPAAAFRDELAPPPATAYDLLDPEDEGGDWGNLP